MADSLDNITGARFAFCPYHGSSFVDSSQCFSEVTGSAHKWNFKVTLIDMIYIISRGKNFGFINVIYLDCLKNLCFCKVADPALCHDWYGHRFLNSTDHSRIAHSRHSSGGTYISGYPFQSHNSTSTRSFRNFSLFRSRNIHDHAAL